MATQFDVTGTTREVLLSENAVIFSTGIVRETLASGSGNPSLHLTDIVREVLVPSASRQARGIFITYGW